MARSSRRDSSTSSGDYRLKPLTHSILRPEVDDEHVVEHRADEFAEVLVSRMIDVGVAVRFALERQDEAVGATFVVGFFAHVGPPFIVLNLFNLLFQIAEGVFDLFDLLVGRALLELEGDDVAQFGGRCRSAFRGGDGQDQAKNECRNQLLRESFHSLL